MNTQLNGNTVIARLTDGSYRTFQTVLPPLINIRGFKNLNIHDVLGEKISTKDYSSQILDTELRLGFTINNGRKDVHYVLTLEESLIEVDLTDVSENIRIMFKSMQHEINKLKSQLRDLEPRSKGTGVAPV